MQKHRCEREEPTLVHFQSHEECVDRRGAWLPQRAYVLTRARETALDPGTTPFNEAYRAAARSSVAALRLRRESRNHSIDIE